MVKQQNEHGHNINIQGSNNFVFGTDKIQVYRITWKNNEGVELLITEEHAPDIRSLALQLPVTKRIYNVLDNMTYTARPTKIEEV